MNSSLYQQAPARPSAGSAFRLLRRGLAFVAVLALLSCNLFDRDLGEAATDPADQDLGSKPLDELAGGWLLDSLTNQLEVFADPQSVPASPRSEATVHVRVFDANHNPLRKKTVRFAANLGTITALDTTDENGEATAVYRGVAQNGEARILVAVPLDTLALAGTSLFLTGAEVEILPASPDTTVGKAVPVRIRVKDGEGQPVAGANLALSGTEASSGRTDGQGIFETSVSRSTEGQVKIKASAIGVSDSLTVGFWKALPGAQQSTVLLFLDPPRLPAADGQSSQVRAIVYDDRHNPVSGRRVTFSASHGRVSAEGTTDENGVATATFFAEPINADVTISATAAFGDSLRQATATVNVVGLQLDIKPKAVDVQIRDTIPVSILLRDAEGRPMGNVPLALEGLSADSGRTNASGAFNAFVTRSQESQVRLKVSALGAADSATVFFWRELPTEQNQIKNTVGNLRIFVEPSKLLASNSDKATVRVVAFDPLNNPLAGKPVRFTANYGIISAEDETDADGVAEAVFRSVPLNVDARVTATMDLGDSVLSVATTISLQGLRVEIIPAQQNALLNREVPVLIRLVDGAGQPVPEATVFFNGNPGIGKTDGAGVFRTAVTSGSQTRVPVTASALGAEASSYVDFWTVLPGQNQNVDSIRKMRIFSSRSQLRADNTDIATITVLLTNDENNPAVGEKVRFSANLGVIDAEAVVDSAGRAQAVLRSAPINGLCRVTASAEGRNLTATTEVAFSGVTLRLSPDASELKTDQTSRVEVSLRDGSGNPIGGDEVTLTLSGSDAVFENGEDEIVSTVGPDGNVAVRVTGSEAGNVTVTASALNAEASVLLRYSNNTLTLSANDGSLQIGGGESATLTATLLNGSGSPLSGVTLTFGTSGGTLSARTAITGGDGKASVTLASANFAGTATIVVTTSGSRAETTVDFTPVAPAGIRLTSSPDNIAINGGKAILRAEIVDAQGNRVGTENVTFRLLSGPGGQASIPQPLTQSQSGIAETELLAGSVPSAYRGVAVEARVGNLSDTVQLTFSGPPHIITVSRPEDDSVTVPKGGIRDESTFDAFVGAVVQDINGNPVADGTEVHFSVSVTGMAIRRLLSDGWSGVGSVQERKPKYLSYYQIIPFEDMNGNFSMDPGIDLKLDDNDAVATRGEDVDGNGVFDWNAADHDFWYDFNDNGVCDAGVAEDPNPLSYSDSVSGETVTLFHDLNQDGFLNPSELLVDRGAAGCGDQPASGDYPFARWETRRFLTSMNFRDNEFAMVISVAAVTEGGVAETRLTYPRQLAQRLTVTVNAEANGLRDKNGESFILPKIVEE